MENYSQTEINYIFNKLIKFTEKAKYNKEVPITACFATKNLKLISLFEKSNVNKLQTEVAHINGLNILLIETNHNLTNKTGNATKHCEIIAIQNIQDFNNNNKEKIDFNLLDCFVTVEPCIMCAYALKLANIRKTYFILANAKFGGLVSLLKIKGIEFKQIKYKDDTIIDILKNFYEDGNDKLEPEKRHRKNKLKKIKQ